MQSGTLAQSLKRQVSITFALVIREMTTRYGSKFGGYMWAILDPVLTITILTLVFSALARVPALGRSFTLFFASGYAAFYLYRSMSDQICSSVEANRALLNYPIVRPYDTIIARVILQTATLFVINIVIFGFLYITVPIQRIDLGPIFLAAAVALPLGAGVGISNIVWFHFSSVYKSIWGVVNRPAFIVSGVFYLPETLPPPFRDLIMWNPLVHIVGLFRRGIYPNYKASYVDLSYVGGLAIFSVVFGLCLVWLFDGKLREPK
ncbi:ABC transporter permease [Labrenzia sp. VG12]|uniref:ABC transporter permease n=1 Tax=Labrenzia sp. VG12 TaxID=2021862 RepID=UPI000B8C0248|nr:ABC transporter permease [Labrenzia sp. VG12]ASP35867.1 sugar ABC transporter [Labrenzia sp. VG12]